MRRPTARWRQAGMADRDTRPMSFLTTMTRPFILVVRACGRGWPGWRGRALAEPGHVLDHQLRGYEGVEQFGQRVAEHSDSPADVHTPPRRLSMPSGLPLGRMRENPAVVHPLDVLPVETGMGPVEASIPPGASTRAACASTAAKSSTSVEIHTTSMAGNAPSAKAGRPHPLARPGGTGPGRSATGRLNGQA